MKTNKYPISKYFSFYFLGKFESTERSLLYTFLITLISLISAIGVFFISEINLYVNILLPFSMIGIISSILVSKKFLEMKNGIEYKELCISTYLDGASLPKEVISLARSNVFLLSLGLFTSIVNIILSKDIIDLLLSILILGLSLFFLFQNYIYEELKVKDKTIKIVVFGFSILVISLGLRYLKMETLASYIYLLPMSLVCGIIGFVKTNKLLNKLFSKTAKNKYYVNTLVNYGNLVDMDTKESTPKTNKSTNDKKTSKLSELMAQYEREEKEKEQINIIKNNSLRREYERMEQLKNGYTSSNKNYSFKEAKEETDEEIRNSEFYKKTGASKTSGYSTELDNPKDSRFDARKRR